MFEGRKSRKGFAPPRPSVGLAGPGEAMAAGAQINADRTLSKMRANVKNKSRTDARIPLT
jgi:hypothetical protein